MTYKINLITKWRHPPFLKKKKYARKAQSTQQLTIDLKGKMSDENTTSNLTACEDAILNQGSGNAIGSVAHDFVAGDKYGKNYV